MDEVLDIYQFSKIPDRDFILGFELLAIGYTVLAIVVPDHRLTSDAKTRAVAILPVSRATGGHLFAAEKAEVGLTRRNADHVVAACRLEYFFLAAGTLLIVSPFAQLLERILFQHLMTTVGLCAADVTAPRLAPPASVTMTQRAANRSRSLGTQIRTANTSVNAATMLAIQAGFYRRSVFAHLLSPCVLELIVEQVPEGPEVHLDIAPHRRILVLMLQGVVEARRYVVFCAPVANPAVADPARQRFELVLAAEHALEVGFRHCVLVGGFGLRVENSRFVEVEKVGRLVNDWCCRTKEKLKGVASLG